MFIVISNYNFSTVSFPGEGFSILSDDEQISSNIFLATVVPPEKK
jgi:hypothetical protein